MKKLTVVLFLVYSSLCFSLPGNIKSLLGKKDIKPDEVQTLNEYFQEVTNKKKISTDELNSVSQYLEFVNSKGFKASTTKKYPTKFPTVYQSNKVLQGIIASDLDVTKKSRLLRQYRDNPDYLTELTFKGKYLKFLEENGDLDDLAFLAPMLGHADYKARVKAYNIIMTISSREFANDDVQMKKVVTCMPEHKNDKYSKDHQARQDLVRDFFSLVNPNGRRRTHYEELKPLSPEEVKSLQKSFREMAK